MTRVAFAGSPGAFGEEAARHFGTPEARGSFAEVFDAVARGAVELGVVPVENSHAGLVAESYDLLRDRDLFVRAAIVLPVRHCLLAPKGADLAMRTEARSHPQALAQCAEYLRSRGLTPVPEGNTATAAKHVAAGEHPRAFAIASHAAAELYGLEVIAEDIQTATDNATRFFAIARQSGAGPITITRFRSEDPGTSIAGLQLAHVHTRPGGAAQVVFAEGTSEAIEALRARVDVTVLGTFGELDLRNRPAARRDFPP
jgi:prephenate dehydratase